MCSLITLLQELYFINDYEAFLGLIVCNMCVHLTKKFYGSHSVAVHIALK